MELNFDNASLVVSNLGGLGGPTGSNVNGPPVMRIGGVATLADGTVIDLEISNVTAYEAFSSDQNDLKPKSGGTFGSINMLAPRSSDVESTFVQLRFAFLSASDDSLVTLGRTYVTFYDFDNSRSGLRECMQVRGGVVGEALTADTELELFEINQTEIAANGVSGLDPTLQQIIASQPAGLINWDTSEGGVSRGYCSRVEGTGKDNPDDPRELTAVQRSRSVLLTLDRVSSFDVRYALVGGTGTGRNFLFAGYSNVASPLCEFPPPSSPPSKPPPVAPSPPPTPPPPSTPPISPSHYTPHTPAYNLQNHYTRYNRTSLSPPLLW